MRSLLGLVAVALLTIPAAAKDPLRFFPESADAVIKVEKPRALVEAIVHHDLAKDAQNLQVVKDFLDGADARRFFQLLAYFERELGAQWPELIDKLAGDGIAVGLKYGQPPATALVLQGTDEATVARFFDMTLTMIDEEVARQGGKEKPKRKSYQGIDCVQLDKELLAARVGDALLLANKNESLKAVIDQHVANMKDPKARNMATAQGPKDARKLLPPDPAAWAWVNLKPVKELPQAKDLFTTPRNDIVQTVLFADILDVARRSDFVAGGLYHEHGNFRLTVKLPAGREGMAEDVELHLPRDPKVLGTLPLLEPKGALFSYSFYLDLDTLYRKRDAIMPAKVAKDFAEGEKQVSRFLLGTTLPKYFSQAGVHYRIVAVQPEKVDAYKTEPSQRFPAFAIVVSMRDPDFAKTTTALIRAGALAVGTQASLKPWEEEIAGVRAFGYSFPDDGKFPDDPLKVRFNYQPTFGAVRDQYVLASNKGLFRELVRVIETEDRSQPARPNMRIRLHASALGDYANLSPEQALASTIITQGLTVEEARKQTDALFAYLRKLGTVNLQFDFADREFTFDVDWKTHK